MLRSGLSCGKIFYLKWSRNILFHKENFVPSLVANNLLIKLLNGHANPSLTIVKHLSDVSRLSKNLPSLENADSNLLNSSDIQKRSELEHLINEDELPKSLLPSERQNEREIALDKKIRSCNNMEDIFLLLEIHKDAVSKGHYVSAHIVIRNMILSRKLDPKDLLRNKSFEMLCNLSYRSCRNFEVNELVAIFNSLIVCQVDINSVIMQSIMQVLRKSLHLFSLKDLVLSEKCFLKLTKSSGLSDALHYGISLQMQRMIQHDLIEPNDFLNHCFPILCLLENIKDVSSIAYVVKLLASLPEGLTIMQEYNLIMRLLQSQIVNALKAGSPEHYTVRSYIEDFVNSLPNAEVQEVINKKKRNALLLYLHSAHSTWGFHTGLRHTPTIRNIMAMEMHSKQTIKDLSQFCDILDRINYIPVAFIEYVCQTIFNLGDDITTIQAKDKISLVKLLTKSTYSQEATANIGLCLKLLLEKPWDTKEVKLETECNILLSLFRINRDIPEWLDKNIFSSPSFEHRLKEEVLENKDIELYKESIYKNIIEIIMILRDLEYCSNIDKLSYLTNIVDNYWKQCNTTKERVSNTPLLRSLTRIFDKDCQNIESSVYYNNYFIDHVLGFNTADNSKLINVEVLKEMDNAEPSSIKLIAILDLKNQLIVGPRKIPHGLPAQAWLKGRWLYQLGFEVIYLSSSELKQMSSSHSDNAVMKLLSKYFKLNKKAKT